MNLNAFPLYLLGAILLFSSCNVDPYDQLILTADYNAVVSLPAEIPVQLEQEAQADSIFYNLNALLAFQELSRSSLEDFDIETVELDTMVLNAGSLSGEFASMKVYAYLQDIRDTILIAQLDSIARTATNAVPLRVEEADIRNLFLFQTAEAAAADTLPQLVIRYTFRDQTLNGNAAFDLQLTSRLRIVGELDR